jgi:hypothetical protein
MLFKIDFYECKNGKYPTLETVLIFADSVSECKKVAQEMLLSFKQKNVSYAIEEAL